jgi:hypothetical protein
MKALRISERLALKLWRAPLERWPKTDGLAGRTNRKLRRPNKSLEATGVPSLRGLLYQIFDLRINSRWL